QPGTGVGCSPKGNVTTIQMTKHQQTCSAAFLSVLLCIPWSAGAGTGSDESQQGDFTVSIKVDAARTQGELKPIWRFFGADEPNYATMKNGRKLLGELGILAPQNVYFRAHNLLTTGDGTPALKWGSTGAYSEDAQANPVYQWRILDGIFDDYLE